MVVWDIELLAGLHEDLLNALVVAHADSGEEVVDCVVVQTQVEEASVERGFYIPVSRRVQLGFTPVSGCVSLVDIAGDMLGVVVH